jgi:anti-anti-sigma factor
VDLRLAKRSVSENVIVVQIIGEAADYYSVQILKDFLNDILDSGCNRVVIDMAQAENCSTATLGALVGLLKRIMRSNGSCAIVMNDDNSGPMKTFRLTGLNRAFDIFNDVTAAVDHVSEGHPKVLQSKEPSQPNDGSEGHWFTVRVYTSDEAAGPAVEESLRAVFDAFGLDEIYAFPPQIRSWFREILVRIRNPTLRPTRDEILTLLKEAAEQQALGKAQTEIDIAQSQAVANLLTALNKTPNALVQVGSTIVLKAGDVVLVQTLSRSELKNLQQNPDLFRDPVKVLTQLQAAQKPEAVDSTLVTVHGFGSTSATWDRLCDAWQNDKELKRFEVHRSITRPHGNCKCPDPGTAFRTLMISLSLLPLITRRSYGTPPKSHS